MGQRVFVDANVFFSKTLMDWLFHLRCANPGMFQICSTEDVFAEVLANMRERHPTAPGYVTARRLELMRKVVDEVIRDFPGDVPFTGSDPKDYHVHAAATAARAAVVLTCDDPADVTATPDDEHYEVMHPDEFFVLVADSAPSCLIPITQDQLRYWMAKPDARQLDDALTRAGCPRFAGRIHHVLSLMARLP